MLVQPQPPSFKLHSYSFEVKLEAKETSVWKWLNDPRTFTDTQVWPYKVEFYSPDPSKVPKGFHEGVLTNHTGPFVNFAGVLTSIQPNYRDLQYYYGSYALSFRLVRPCRLEFETRNQGAQTVIKCTITSYVKPSFYRIWDLLNRQFWKRFRRWSKRSVLRLEQAVK